MEIEETPLPGIGLKHEFTVASGRRIGVISRQSGKRDLLVYDEVDPDACREEVLLTDEESDALAELLGAPRIVERIARLHDQVTGLLTENVTIPPGALCSGRTIADSLVRTRTGASIVAIVRHGEMKLSPRSDFVIEDDDTVLIIGTRDSIDQAIQLLTTK
jgi:K+:H+ antiporter subunit KhtT